MPEPGESVIAFMSGGLDTTVSIGVLLAEFKLLVYPLYVDRGFASKKKLESSIDYFSSLFSHRFPNQFHSPLKIRINIPHMSFSKPLIAAESHLIPNQKKARKGIPLQPAFYSLQAFHYAKYLEETRNIKVRTILGAWLPSNSEWYRYERLSSFRAQTLALCIQDNDNSWQFTSLAMEKELGFYFDKDVLTQLGHYLDLPLEKTWTCFFGYRYQCGVCPVCTTRKNGFKKAGIRDKTIYLNKLPWEYYVANFFQDQKQRFKFFKRIDVW